MKIKEHKVLFIFINLLILVLLFSTSKSLKAATQDAKTQKGEIIFVTKDTKATSSITWSTVGFTICRSECLPNGGYPTKLKHATIYLKDNWKHQIDNHNGTYTVIFTIPEEEVNNALVNLKYAKIQDNDIIYLNGIFQVWHNGKKHDGKIYNLPTIQKAESWRNPKDFKDHFDIKVQYHSSGAQPVTVRYITQANKVISEEKLAPVKLGKMVNVTLDKEKNYESQTLALAQSTIYYMANQKKVLNNPIRKVTSVNAKNYNDQVKDVYKRSYQQAPGGLLIVALMRPKKPKGNRDSEVLKVPLEEPTPHGVIAADERDDEQFNVEEGIPTTEKLYTNVFSNNYLLGYTFTRKHGTKVYTVNATRTYHLTWTETDPKTKKKVTKKKSVPVPQEVYIKRDFSYWEISKIEYYKIDHAAVKNYALPGGVSKLTPVGYTVPKLNYTNRVGDKDHMIEPNLIIEPLPAKSKNLKEAPVEDYTKEVNAIIKQIKVRNDKLEFDGTQIMDDKYVEKKTKDPEDIDVSYDETGDDVLYRPGQAIDATKANGIYESTGSVNYKVVKQLNGDHGNTLSYPVSDLTNVVIHTPTVCDAFISNKATADQMITPDVSLSPLVLDTPFTIQLPTEGEHLDIDGYGYQDYAKYIKSREVKFPFDVYEGSTYIRAGTWVTLTQDETSFYLPIWVDEGKYNIDFRSISINAETNGGIDKTQELANLERNNYVATDQLSVEVSGRVYGLKLFDISDYPIWENVFRQENSLRLSGFNYTVGTNDQNGVDTGRNPKYTFTLLNGSHPGYSNIGAIKTGYVTRFQLTTIGNMYSDQDSVHIKPTFYYVDSKGGNRQPVDLYYSETFRGQKQILVKVGSFMDQFNTKAYRLGDPYFGVPDTELNTKAMVTGRNRNEIRGNKKNLFSYSNVLIRENLRTYIGTNYTPTGTVPYGVDPDKVTKSMQKWYGEYYLPSEIHVVPQGYDVIGYAKNHYGIDYKEDFWLKNGYIVVNFDIETIQNGNPHLSYLNLENAKNGYCNMWRTEGYQYEKKDYKGNTFEFQDGDYIMYYTDKSAAEDYKSGGTH
ncbi:DUF5704 domain-containing protein [Anaeromicropila herbilytica]|uniref:DUF5704 domain-containing protein n=1 Tax=Anaeromicropila herbilytica TaxID=2785025 RepID=A0A7R7IFT5_9FIRM|nr:DUF5704 domain-containing protein [Anaeromicropila herbilytica]BCN32408.1 hypothetical protein bsdtb5_37030 [Anaeromicropila herbilytica]